MNKLLISLLSLVGASAVGTGGYFLLRGNIENSEQKVNDGQGSGGEEASASGVGGVSETQGELTVQNGEGSVRSSSGNGAEQPVVAAKPAG